MLLKTLTEANGVSGNESEVRKIIISEIKDHVDDLKIDRLGNIIAYKKGKKDPEKTLMVAAHMDEVGLLVEEIDDMGLLKFMPVGGIDKRILVSKVVSIGDKKLPGVIGAKPIHLQKPEERKSALAINDLYIDFGASSKEDAEAYVSVGDYVAFKSDYREFGNGFVKAKALDDRVGCAILIDLLKNVEDTSFYGVFTVMEELGLRGAGPAAFSVDPDFALILEGTICADQKGTDGHMMATRSGQGPAISLIDYGSIYDYKTREKLVELAENKEIPYQYRKSAGGGNDSGKIHLTRDGAVTAAISVPCRYIHSNVSVMNKEDFNNAYRLAYELVNNFAKEDM